MTMLPEDWVAQLEDEKRFLYRMHHDTHLVRLGIQRMPDGYALMWSGATEHYFWLRWDGAEGHINVNKWAAYHGAKEDSKKWGSPERVGG